MDLPRAIVNPTVHLVRVYFESYIVTFISFFRVMNSSYDTTFEASVKFKQR